MTIMNGTNKSRSQAMQNRDQGGGPKKQGLLPTATGRAQILLWYQNDLYRQRIFLFLFQW